MRVRPCSILDVLLGRFLATMGISQTGMSIAYAIYGMFQVAGTVIVLLLQCSKRIARIPLAAQFLILTTAISIAAGSTLIMVLMPYSYAMLLLARAVQGTCGAVYYVYGLILLARFFPPEWQLQAVAFMTAGEAVM